LRSRPLKKKRRDRVKTAGVGRRLRKVLESFTKRKRNLQHESDERAGGRGLRKKKERPKIRQTGWKQNLNRTVSGEEVGLGQGLWGHDS